MRIYTRGGDDGTTALLYGGRVRKDAEAPRACGDVDELQASIGVLRAELGPDDPLSELLIRLGADLWVLMSELATAPDNAQKLVEGKTKVSDEMVSWIEGAIDGLADQIVMPREFIVPGANRPSALADLARTVARRAERSALSVLAAPSAALRYLNRISDLLWMVARALDSEKGAAVTTARGALR